MKDTKSTGMRSFNNRALIVALVAAITGLLVGLFVVSILEDLCQ